MKELYDLTYNFFMPYASGMFQQQIDFVNFYSNILQSVVFLFFPQDYLLCSHLCPESLQDVYLYLKYNCILHLVSTRSTDDLVLWHEIYPTHLCHTEVPDNPGYREPKARWFLLIVSLVGGCSWSCLTVARYGFCLDRQFKVLHQIVWFNCFWGSENRLFFISSKYE